MLQLRPYQERDVPRIRAAYAAGARAVLYVLPTGGGKTIGAAYIISAAVTRGNRVLFVAGRTELLGQTVNKLADAGVTDVRLIQAERDLGGPDAPVTVASIDTITQDGWLERIGDFDLVIVDECLPAGTMVDGRPIEDLRVGDLVRSYNESTRTIEMRPIRRLFSSHPSTLVTVLLEDGRRITCTAGHPFFVGDRYRPAMDLKPGEWMYGDCSDDALYGVRLDGDCNREGEARHRTEIGPDLLLDDVPRHMGVTQQFGADVAHQSQAREQAHDRPQPDATRRGAREDARHPPHDPASTARARWKRDGTLPDGGASVGSPPSRLDGEPCRADQATSWDRIPHQLQDRPSESDSAPGDRSGRIESRIALASRARCKKAGVARVTRVVRVEVHERRGPDGFGDLCPKDRVYNIEVEGNHNYFVDGILVHNCHHSTCAKVRRILQRQSRARLLGLTATPMRGDKTPLSPPFDAMVVGPSVRELTALGHLVPCRLLCPPRDARLPSNTLAMDPAEALQRYGTGAPAVVFCRDVKHSIAVAAAIPGAGHIDGRMSARRRAAVLADLAAGAIRVLCSVDVVTEGFDFPPLADAVMARKFGHVGRWIQAIGRVLRPAPGKTRATVIDLCGSAHEHGPPDAPRTYSLDGEGIAAPTRLAFRTCRACYAMFETADACPHCGAAVPLADRAAPRIADVELVDLEPKTPAPRREWVTGPLSARFPGRCVRCAREIRRGDEIMHATLAKTTWHRRCPSTEMQNELR